MTANRWTWHGGGVKAARAHFGGTDWIDLSTGINPHPWPHADTTPVNWRDLPCEHALRELEATAAQHFGAAPDNVCAVPGTEVGLRIVGEFLPAPVCHVSPTYRTHAEMAACSRAVSREELAAHQTGTLILAHPNNPEGYLAETQGVLDRVKPANGTAWVALDEAFTDCDPARSMAQAVDDATRLIVFRSFGKFFGLAGLRLGFVIAPSAIVQRLRAKLGAWPVSAAAIAIGTAAYRDRQWVQHMREKLDNDARQVDLMLRSMGYTVSGECPLFRLIDCADGHALFHHLARQQILTRPFDGQPRWLRIGLPENAQALDRLARALPCHG